MPFTLLFSVLIGIAALLFFLARATARGLSIGAQRLLEGGAAAGPGPVGIPPRERLAALQRQAAESLQRLGRGKRAPRSLGQRLKWAGVGLSPEAWQALPYPLGALGGVLGIAAGLAVPHYLPVTVFAGALVGGAGPSVWLSSRLTRRRVRIAAEILTYTEYLAMAMQAGADFRTAVSQVEERFPGPVADAFSTAVFTSAIGGELDDGLRAAQATLSNRDADAIISVLIKQRVYGAQGADQLLESVAAVRRERVEKVLEKASRAAMMLLLPIAIFIVPVFFGLVLYPMLSQAMAVLR